MTNSNLNPCNCVSRRRFFFQAGGGFLGLSLGALLADAGGPRPLPGRGSPNHFFPI